MSLSDALFGLDHENVGREKGCEPGPGRPEGPVTVPVVASSKVPIMEGIADILIANPGIRTRVLATKLRMSPVTVRNILKSDLFSAALEARKEKIVDPKIKESLEMQFTACLEECIETITDAAVAGSLDAAVQGAKISAEALGFGAKQLAVNNTQFVMNIPQQAVSAEQWVAQNKPVVEAAG